MICPTPIPAATLRFLGLPRLERGQTEWPIGDPKIVCLLFLLAIVKSPSRDWIASVLWADLDQSRRLANLRNTLHRLKQQRLEDLLTISDTEIGLATGVQTDIDVVVSEHPMPLEIAVNAANTRLLNGNHCEDVPYLNARIRQISQHYKSKSINTIHQEVKRLREKGRLSQCIMLTRRILLISPYNEAALRNLMLLYAENGDRASALNIYQDFKGMLRSHQGIDPETRTAQLHLSLLQKTIAESQIDFMGSADTVI